MAAVLIPAVAMGIEKKLNVKLTAGTKTIIIIVAIFSIIANTDKTSNYQPKIKHSVAPKTETQERQTHKAIEII